MSLLMDALKKAEKNRPGSTRSSAADEAGEELARALAETPLEVPPAPVRATRSTPPVRPSNNFRERDPLSLVLADDPPFEPAAAPTAAPAPAGPRRRALPAAPISPNSNTPMRGERLAAANVFSAKTTAAPTRRNATPRNPKTGFYAVIGALTMAALGVVGYFYWQLTGGPGLGGGSLAGSGVGQVAGAGVSGTVAPQPPVRPTETAVNAVTSATTGTTSQASTATGPNAALAATSGATPAVAKSPEPVPATSPPPKPVPPRQPLLLAVPGVPAGSRPPAATTAAVSAPTLAPATQIKITRTTNLPSVHGGVSTGYEALRQGKLADAERAYRNALEADRTNRDALLGLAAVMQRTARNGEAERLFGRLVELDPEDADAHAGLLGLRQSRAPADQGRDESRLKSLIAREQRAAGSPSSANATTATAGASQLALGNQLAAQGRWPEAQQAYFAAHSADPGSADILYNLAVSLDQLGQRRLASDYYDKAAGAAQTRGGQFDLGRAKARAAQLAAPATPSASATPTSTPVAVPQ